MKGLDGKSGVTAGVTGVTEPDLSAHFIDPLGDFLSPDDIVANSTKRLLAARNARAAEMEECERRRSRPKKDEARANLADDHVVRVVVAPDGKTLRFGYGIDKAIAKGFLPMACARACERFRLDAELANAGGAHAIVDPTRVRVDTSVRARLDGPVGAVSTTEPFARAIAALGGPKAATAILAVRCIAEGKTVEIALGELRAYNLCVDVKIARGMLWAASIMLRVHYGY